MFFFNKVIHVLVYVSERCTTAFTLSLKTFQSCASLLYLPADAERKLKSCAKYHIANYIGEGGNKNKMK